LSLRARSGGFLFKAADTCCSMVAQTRRCVPTRFRCIGSARRFPSPPRTSDIASVKGLTTHSYGGASSGADNDQSDGNGLRIDHAALYTVSGYSSTRCAGRTANTARRSIKDGRPSFPRNGSRRGFPRREVVRTVQIKNNSIEGYRFYANSADLPLIDEWKRMPLGSVVVFGYYRCCLRFVLGGHGVWTRAGRGDVGCRSPRLR